MPNSKRLHHIPLGIITPVPNPVEHVLPADGPTLSLASRPLRIRNRTHDLKQIQHRQSLPIRLTQPRLYIEQISSTKLRPVLPTKISGSSEYELAVRLYGKIGAELGDKTKRALEERVREYTGSNLGMTKSAGIFFNRQQFEHFLLSQFSSFSREEAEQFWAISYNQLRFKQKISASAFVYNYCKFHLDYLNYHNTFSQPALRQRMIDLRVALFDWATNDICFKFNQKLVRQELDEMITSLQDNDELQCDAKLAMQQFQATHSKMRFLAQALFALTDCRLLTFDKISECLASRITERAHRIELSRQVIHKYYQMHDYSSEERFAITELLQFCKLENYPAEHMSTLVSWMQGLFDYLYFHHPEDKQLGLTLNFSTRRLQCTNILHVNAYTIRAYDEYLQAQYDIHSHLCQHLSAMLEDIKAKMPVLKGSNKKEVLEGNYVAETLGRFVRGVDCKVFWRVLRLVEQHMQGGELGGVLKAEPAEEDTRKTMKKMFAFPQSETQIQAIQESQAASVSRYRNQVEAALDSYKQVKEQPLTMKLRPIIKQQKQQSLAQKISNPIQQTKPPNPNPSKKKNNIKTQQQQQQINSSNSNSNYTFEDLQRLLSMDIPLGSTKHWHEVSRQTNETIRSVESMESRLFDLLDLHI